MELIYINTEKLNGPLNMAIDEILLSRKKSILRLYQWENPTITIGRFQKISDIDLKFAKKKKIHVIRRITGGKTVLHNKELTYTFIIKENLMPKSIIDSYNLISNALILGLNNFNIKPKMHKVKQNDKNNPNCFSEPSFNEIVVKKKKIIGSAQTRTNGMLLQHGSILIDIDYSLLSNIFSKKARNLSSLKKRITSINIELGINLKISDLENAVIDGFKEFFKVKLIKSQITKKELFYAIKLAKNKYESRNWNYYGKYI
jgi:lipoyl(octanoyl) transferase